MAVSGSTPKFHNQLAVREIRIGVREFNCIGVLPPHDHPHIYLAMEHRSLCPYCSTLFVFDERLAPTETDPAGCYFEEQTLGCEASAGRRAPRSFGARSARSRRPYNLVGWPRAAPSSDRDGRFATVA